MSALKIFSPLIFLMHSSLKCGLLLTLLFILIYFILLKNGTLLRVQNIYDHELFAMQEAVFFCIVIARKEKNIFG